MGIFYNCHGGHSLLGPACNAGVPQWRHFPKFRDARYPELPPIRMGANYSDSIKSIRSIEIPQTLNIGNIVRSGYLRVVSLLDSADVVYQEDPNGRTVACLPLLAARIDDVAFSTAGVQRVFNTVLTNAGAILPVMLGAARKLGLFLDGLEHAVKGASHIVDKAQRYHASFCESRGLSNAPIEDVAASLNDLIRFRVVCRKEVYVDSIRSMTKALECAGMEVESVSNRFLDRDGNPDPKARYRAVHVVMRFRRQLFEVQFHDCEALPIVNETHLVYEQWRKMQPENPDYNRLYAQCVDAWRNYENPVGIEEIRPRKAAEPCGVPMSA